MSIPPSQDPTDPMDAQDDTDGDPMDIGLNDPMRSSPPPSPYTDEEISRITADNPLPWSLAVEPNHLYLLNAHGIMFMSRSRMDDPDDIALMFAQSVVDQVNAEYAELLEIEKEEGESE